MLSFRISYPCLIKFDDFVDNNNQEGYETSNEGVQLRPKRA
jgi:hypothetical protein